MEKTNKTYTLWYGNFDRSGAGDLNCVDTFDNLAAARFAFEKRKTDTDGINKRPGGYIATYLTEGSDFEDENIIDFFEYEY